MCVEEVLFSYDGGVCWQRVPLSEALLLDNIRSVTHTHTHKHTNTHNHTQTQTPSATPHMRPSTHRPMAAWQPSFTHFFVCACVCVCVCDTHRIEPDGQRPRVILHGRRCRKSLSPLCAYDAEAPRKGVLEGVMYLVDVQVWHSHTHIHTYTHTYTHVDTHAHDTLSPCSCLRLPLGFAPTRAPHSTQCITRMVLA